MSNGKQSKTNKAKRADSRDMRLAFRRQDKQASRKRNRSRDWHRNPTLFLA